MKKTAPENILLVDDQQAFLATLAEGLTAGGNSFSVLTAENGNRALQILASAPVDVVVTDLKMPVMNGFELLLQMKEKYPHIPAVVMTSFLDSWVEAQLRALGVSQFIDKEALSNSVLGEMIIKSWLARRRKGSKGE